MFLGLFVAAESVPANAFTSQLAVIGVVICEKKSVSLRSYSAAPAVIRA
jgi:hypothetical protein